MRLRTAIIYFILIALCVPGAADACTSLIATGKATHSGRPMLWKHRDTDSPSNYLARIEPRSEDEIGFVGLFNSGDSIQEEAWMGVNDRGFAIMNTASYNLAPDTTAYVDREAFVMGLALRKCVTVEDFQTLLDTLPKPLGVQANFGVIDALGGAAYFETWDHGFNRFNAADDPSGCLIRTNFSYSGKDDGSGSGYIRNASAHHLLDYEIDSGNLTPRMLTDGVSRSFYHSLLGRDPLADGDTFIADGEFIPRRITTASIVVEGPLPGEDPAESVKIYAVLGYPPLGTTYEFDLSAVPEELQGSTPDFDSKAAKESLRLRDEVFPFHESDMRKYIDLNRLRQLIDNLSDL